MASRYAKNQYAEPTPNRCSTKSPAFVTEFCNEGLPILIFFLSTTVHILIYDSFGNIMVKIEIQNSLQQKKCHCLEAIYYITKEDDLDLKEKCGHRSVK